ncbi:N-6 DNA methylase [Flavobacterium sp.]|uniref:N-6 DNA methylase n=1 Tax=Flavobacterium sp. TaxID=239 RepID=UPI00286C9B73|nr:N-6 DNA methylase [Flavobacterium sp.]
MNFVKVFFENRNFDFNSDFELKQIYIYDNDDLTNKLKGNTFFYKSPENTKTSFYAISIEISNDELYEVRKYLWNEDKSDLFFTFDKKENANIYYAKSDPKSKVENYKIISFKGSEKDKEELERVNKWEFESGKFWLTYSDFLDKIKKSKRVDEKLIETLQGLRKSLHNEFNSENNKEEIVQALIDRTLYIKFLEDNHIINSFFYTHYFGDGSLTYSKFLKNNNVLDVNKLYKLINEIFNNFLFKIPVINENHLTNNVCQLIFNSVAGYNSNTGQLSLFDFQFNIIPIEFISYIYEVFLEEINEDNGIYYTPKKLAQLIIDDVIINNKLGKVLDPACGSGMFLVVAFQKLLEEKNLLNHNDIKSKSISEIIENRNKILQDYIFGIEKQETARRLCVFSLYLEMFRNIEPERIKKYIEDKLKTEDNLKLFPYNFFENIRLANSLDISEDRPFKDDKFDFIVGNPPFFKIKKNDDEINFVNEYQNTINGVTLQAKNIIGHNQISQAFLLKIKDWANYDTRFGFVVNNSNLYNEMSINFQKFFYTNYKLERLYELTRVKEILFRIAKESVNALIFSNNPIANNSFEYFPVENGLFSNYFDLLVIQEDKGFYINQDSVLNETIKLRDYLIGNDFDRSLNSSLLNNSIKLEELLIKNEKGKPYSYVGMEIVEEIPVCKEFNISKSQWDTFPKKTRYEYYNKFREIYTRKTKEPEFETEFVKSKNFHPFVLKNIDTYIGDINNFHRPRNIDIYNGNRILFKRVGATVISVYTKKAIYSNFDINTIKLTDEASYYLINAILNSKTINYFLNSFVRKRTLGSFPKISTDDILNIPIPTILDEDLVNEITLISKDLTEEKYIYDSETDNKLNELIFDLYGLTFIEKQRIKDFFIKKKDVTKVELEWYKKSLATSLEIYFENQPKIECYLGNFNLIVFGIYFNNSNKKEPSEKKISQFIIDKVLKENPNEKFLLLREKIIGQDCAYIIKNNNNINWTVSKAFEDAQDIIKKANG